MGFNYFTMPDTVSAVENTSEREHLPYNSIKTAPYTFHISTGPSYIDLNKTRMVFRWVLWKYDDTTHQYTKFVDDKDKVAHINGFGAVWPENVTCTISGQQIYSANNLYPFKAYYDMILGYGEDVKKSYMRLQGFHYDASAWPKDSAALILTESFKNRQECWFNGNEVEFSAPFYIDLFQQPLHFLNNSEITIEISPHKSTFLLHAPNAKATDTTSFLLELKDLRLYTTMVNIHPGVAMDIERQLDQVPAVIPLRRTDMKKFFFEHQRLEGHNTIVTDQVPRRAVLSFIPKMNSIGTYTTDPFYLTNRTTRDLRISYAGNQVPFVPWDLDFKTGRFARAYEHLHRTIGYTGHNIDCGITMDMFKDGYTIFPFNLTTTLEDEDGFDYVREGPTILHVQFKENVPENGVDVMMMLEYDSCLYVDKARTIRNDLTS